MWLNSRYLYFGVALALPFFVANALVAMQETLFLSIVRPLGQPTSYEQALVLTLIALVGVGGIAALLPVVRERSYVVNAIVGTALIAFALFAGYGLGLDVYHCDILQIPNCD